MKKDRFSIEQITGLEAGRDRYHRRRRLSPGWRLRANVLPVEEVYGGMLPGEARELKQLHEENSKLKRIVADLTLDKVMLHEVVHKSSKARAAA